MMKVEQFHVKNQFVITSERGELFQSYDSAIALIDCAGGVHLSRHWNYSRTTSKYRNIFLNESTADTKRKIESGEYYMDLDIDGTILS